MKNKILFIIFCIGLIPTSQAGVTEFDFEFSYSRDVYGISRENKKTERTYSSSIAQYFFTLTGIELSFSYSDKITHEKPDLYIDDFAATLTETQHEVNSKTYGVGIRQALAPRGSFIRPLISVGYAKQFIKYKSNSTYKLDSSTVIPIYGGIIRSRGEFAFGTFSIQ